MQPSRPVPDTWPRPVPTIGDRTSAAERASDPEGWAFPDDDRGALARIMEARRDVRRFRADPVPESVLSGILAAAHRAPSVGHSQPWRFVVVRDPQTRARAAVLADRARLAAAEAMNPDSGRMLLDLDLEGIREAPLGVVVCCDRRVPATGVLGRATFPDADMWSCACAIQNLWLAARAEGLGVGWVTLFRPEDLSELVHAPPGVETLGWLCVGWPDERPPTPGLERRGWSSRQPVEDVVLSERWPADGRGPTAPVSHAPGEAGAPLAPPDQVEFVAAHDTGDVLLSPPGSLGLLDRTVDRVLAVRPLQPIQSLQPVQPVRPLQPLGPVGTEAPRTEGVGPLGAAVLVLAAADHPVVAHGVSAYAPEVTRSVAEASVAGLSVGAVAALRSGLDVVVVDAGVSGEALAGARSLRPVDPKGDLVGADGLSGRDVDRLVEGGAELGRELVAGGCGLVALGEIGVGNTTVAAALAAALLDADPAALVGLGAGSDSAIVEAKRLAVARAVKRARASASGTGPIDPLHALAALGGGEFAVLAGVVLGTAEAGGVVVLDGLATSVAALAAMAISPAVAARLVAGQRSRENGHRVVLSALGLEPLLDLRLRAGEGVGAALAVQMLRTAVSIRAGAARTSEQR